MLDNRTFAEHIIGMMKDYNITMFDALLWDFEAFSLGDAEKLFQMKGLSFLENKFKQYLYHNGITEEADKEFYTGIFMGRQNNMELKDA